MAKHGSRRGGVEPASVIKRSKGICLFRRGSPPKVFVSGVLLQNLQPLFCEFCSFLFGYKFTEAYAAPFGGSVRKRLDFVRVATAAVMLCRDIAAAPEGCSLVPQESTIIPRLWRGDRIHTFSAADCVDFWQPGRHVAVVSRSADFGLPAELKDGKIEFVPRPHIMGRPLDHRPPNGQGGIISSHCCLLTDTDVSYI